MNVHHPSSNRNPHIIHPMGASGKSLPNGLESKERLSSGTIQHIPSRQSSNSVTTGQISQIGSPVLLGACFPFFKLGGDGVWGDKSDGPLTEDLRFDERRATFVGGAVEVLVWEEGGVRSCGFSADDAATSFPIGLNSGRRGISTQSKKCRIGGRWAA
jgi:hypothetical protein